MDTTAVSNTPDFGVFAQLQEYGPIGLAALALGFVAWQFIKRKLAEKDVVLEERKSKKRRK
jgi:hypothetical protein